MLILWPVALSAQIRIGGNVYGGGNHAEVKGSTKVTVKAGDIGAVMDPNATRPLADPQGRVFGGARMANVGGNTFVHIDGENATDYILINQVFGGNDISGTIGTAEGVGEEMPEELSAVLTGSETKLTHPKKNEVDNTFNSYVRISTKATDDHYTAEEIAAAANNPEADAYGKTTDDIKPDPTAKKMYIGQLFAGGNGDFDYEQEPAAGGKVTHKIYNWSDKNHDYPIATVITGVDGVGFQLPELDKTYLEVLGGSIVYGYGGGNNATVKEKNIIHIDNPSKVVNHILVSTAEGTEGVEADSDTYDDYEDNLADEIANPVPTNYTELLCTERFKEMGINTTFSRPSSGAFQIGRFFGGNNKAEMHIRPTWNLLAGKIRNLYSGGNRGKMTSPEGLLLEIKDYSTLIVDNLYGGCRMADVMPTENGVYTPCTSFIENDDEGNPKYKFPSELSARVLILGGHINNVYGGNDVTGTVYGGNAVGIHTTVYGDVYGGGNGDYPYSDSEELKDDDVYGDFNYYDFMSTSGYYDPGAALNAFRPNAEQVSIRLKGYGTGNKYTIIKGSVFLGGNCASLDTKKSKPMVELKMGSYVIADNIYLGNNGQGMIDEGYLKLYSGKVDENGEYTTGEGTKFSNLDLKDGSVFSQYMEGVAMKLQPSIVFDSESNGDLETYIPFSSFVGSLYCGGNVGSMAIGGKETFTVDQGLNIYNKFVGGCNNADVKAGTYNAAYQGGVLGSESERSSYTDEADKIKDRIEINLENMTITPLRWNNTKTQLVWNTNRWDADEYFEIEAGTELIKGDIYYTEAAGVYTKHTVSEESMTVPDNVTYYEKGGFVEVPREPINANNRLLGGNIYGGCYESGHVNGNVIININQELLNRDKVFGTNPDGIFGNPASGVDLEEQRDDLMAVALSVFGGGYGEDTEIWGSTTVNHNSGYVFQIFGGGQEGVVGKKQDVEHEGGSITHEYVFDEAYSTTVNLNGNVEVYSNDDIVENLAETEYLYGGGNEGDVCGNTLVNLGNGRLYDAFGGACDADILGHAEVYIGRQPDGSGGYKDGFPWIKDIVYGGNDFGGTIFGGIDKDGNLVGYEDGYDFTKRLRDSEASLDQIHGYKSGKIPDVLKSSSYVEYLMGRVDTIFGGGYGSYDYNDVELYGVGAAMPVQHSSFVNIRPKDHTENALKSAFGGGTGYPGNRQDDKAQDRSYVLIDIPDEMTKFKGLTAFGAGSYNGMGMRYHLDTETGKTLDEENKAITSLDEASTIIDLLHGHIHNVFGGSYQEGVTRRAVVNVPAKSTIQIDSIFGGAYGKYILPPCDVYETQVNYKNTSEDAQVFGAIFGGNNNERRSLYTQVNISSPVWSNKAKGYTGTVYGAGRGIDTWSEYTEVNLEKGAKVYEVYGGGEMGHVLNSKSIQVYMQTYKDKPSQQISEQDPTWSQNKYWNLDGEGKKVSLKSTDRFNPDDASDTRTILEAWQEDWADAWTLGSYYTPGESNAETAGTIYTKYATNSATNLDRVSNRPELDVEGDNTASLLDGKKYNTNVIVNKGAVVEGYAYGGGLGDASEARTGDVYGNTYVAVLGGEVKKDVYGAGRAGGIDNIFEATGDVGFVASANAYVQGGTARNVYGGGYQGDVGHHAGGITAALTGDRLAKANVVIGKAGTDTFEGGAPAITRNVYGAGEGGSVFGSSHVTLNNGYIGYRYKNTGTESKPKYEYVEELDDKKTGDLDLSGNVFGGGYVVNSFVDDTEIDMYGGTVRGCLYGGGEVGPIGRGVNKTSLGKGGLENGDATIFKAGTTLVNMYDGKVKRNIFGGGRGKDSWGGDGTMYMDEGEVASLKADGLFCKGYVFGQTCVNIHGGEIGTDEGMAYGYGNVFGGCDEGTLYSAYMKNDKLYIGKKIGARYDGSHEGYYFQYGPSDTPAFLDDGDRNIFTEDSKVVIAPHAQAYVDVSITGGTGSPRGDGSYKAGEYVTTEDMNLLKNKEESAAIWDNLDPDGIIIHNAVFAGGNIASGSSSLYANATTVYGNATASIHDVYNRDLITIGTGHTGGLYGDGNLSFVDGYRELNITNYGTDYYHISKQLEYEEYKKLPEREQAYYELKYKCLQECTDYEGTTYKEGSNLPFDELLALFTKPDGNSVLSDVESGDSIIVTVKGKKVPNSDYWEENGVVSVYAGRIMNTIQRADFCGVFGSRMVMKGAQDRVPETADYSNYTINRVREVSLNKKDSKAGDTGDNALHGNYFGIYNKVNYLGALTSDVKFKSKRTTNADLDKNPGLKPNSESETFYDWKELHKDDKTRNNGTCHNHLALASGVYLELTTEKGTGNTLDTKDWGMITGVIELDLINVQTGIGGGFVYARNEHGEPDTGKSNTTLTALNEGAASKWNYTYGGKYNNWEELETDKEEWQTSGNFIHSSQTIIDDCYNVGGKYKGKYGNKAEGGTSEGVPAHYWYIAGSVYVYDQYISAYTGSPNAYSETVEVPITINAASHGTMTLMDVQPNLYAYYSAYTDASNNTPLSGDKKLVINDVTYQLNDPISYWDWNKLPASEQKLFVSDTYVTVAGCKIGSDTIYAGTVMLPSDYKTYQTKAATQTVMSNGKEVTFEEIFRSSNNMSHTTGYLLTYNVTNPSVWDKWYTQIQDNVVDGNYVLVKNQTGGTGFEDGPTYHTTETKLYGQQEYDKNAIIPEKTYNDYQTLKTNHSSAVPTSGQAEFVSAYLITKEYTSGSVHYYPGAPVSSAISGYTSPAYVSTATIQLSPTEFIYVNDLMTEAQKNKYKNDYPSLADDIDACIKPAYICTTAGLYGGSYYEEGSNYRALEAYSAMSETDRQKFAFNYDALDLLIDPNYSKDNNGNIIHPNGKKYQYDSADGDLTGANNNAAHYSLATSIDYTATYKGDEDNDVDYDGGKAMYYYTAADPETKKYVKVGQELSSTVYETLPNEQHHYAPIKVDAGGGTYYVVKESFVHGDTPYAVGATIDSETYGHLSSTEQTNYITTLTFEASEVVKDGSGNPLPFYYCRESYTVNENGEGADVTKIKGEGSSSYTTGGTVPVGFVINATNYSYLPNRQKNFTIHGVSPMETSTLYVARNADINDLSSEKIITVIYKYDYEESDKDGMHITPVSERHVVNIHINFKSGVPTIEDINPPTIVLPGTGITMRIPSVTPGAYEVTGGGWELFEKTSDAESHINGVEYTPSEDPLYWYQDGFYLAYYAKTYLGKTYSNHVPVSVANYHDLKKVMDDKTYHLHVDYDRSRLKRDSKVYINDYSSSSENGLDLFKNFYDLSLISGSGDGYTVNNGKITEATGSANTNLVNHTLLNTHETNGVKGGQNLQFFLRTDIAYTDNPAIDDWTPIGNDAGTCFSGDFHGDGHTISGLDNSLFNYLCRNVYNLGVTGSFTGAGIAEHGGGYVENCWIGTSSTATKTSKPVFGAPSASGRVQIVNSYYMEEDDAANKYTNHAGSYGIPTRKPAQAFYNGEVAYDLNGFYLYKRYNDGVSTASGVEYKYFTLDEDGNIPSPKTPLTGHYADNMSEALCSSGYNGIKYVEERFTDGDFRYDGGDRGVIPDTEDERFYSWKVTDPDTGKETVKSDFYPIWPDDYIFFGQKLTYGWDVLAHQEVPTAVVRDEGRLSLNDDANRVYRAPAYYRNRTMSMAHFNPHAYLAQTQKDVPATKAYPNMTAIDFAGHKEGHDKSAYKLGLKEGWFYSPLLDDDGLLSIQNCDETQNLLVYAPAASGESGYVNATTQGVLDKYFKDPVYDTHYHNTGDYDGYRIVDEASTASIHGHLVQSDLTATNDHLLVDYQDFNAPISYTFDSDHLMWYQRKPHDKEYVDIMNGWQGISIPFTAELVTTDVKGEITHFYGGSTKGHEYWLREFESIAEEEMTINGTPTKVARGSFLYPDAAGPEKSFSNGFLWDYYYKNESYHNQKDDNNDTYLQYRQYYKDLNKNPLKYAGYPLLTAGTPYLVGFPGVTYYEFDLSGKFEAKNTKVSIPKLAKQTITFASDKHITIGVSDDETTGVTKTVEGSSKSYSVTFMPSYMNWNLEDGNYVMNSEGNAYIKLDSSGTGEYIIASEAHTFADAAALTSWMASNYTLYTDAKCTIEATTASGTEVTYYKRVREKTKNDDNNVTPSQSAFRPYFTADITASSSSRSFFAKKIIFGGAEGEFSEGPESVLDGSLEIYTRGYKIYTTSHMKEATTIQIINATGATIANYVLKPGETIETPVAVSGVYVVNKKKVFVE